MKKLALSAPSERIIGFTIPRDGCFYVCDHNEVWEVKLGHPGVVEESDLQPYVVAAGDTFVGWGDQSKSPILRCGDTEIRYSFDPDETQVNVGYSVGSRTGVIEFPTFSGDWFAASLSTDGRYLVLAEPYRLDVYEIE